MFQRLLLGTILFSAAMLLLFGSWYCYTSTFDTATVGLMSVNILQGDRPLFFYGQPYFGALEAYLGAFYLSLFGFSEFVISLSPITFTLAWIVFTYLLFTRIHNRTAGIISAACVAFPGYYVFWYSIATYGGYSATLCIGTAILWLSLRMLQENVQKKSLVLHSVCVGILVGLGIWVHPLTFPYIAIGAAVLALFIYKERFRPDVIISLGIAVLLALTGFRPFYFETGSFFGGVSESVKLSWTVVINALSTLFSTNIFELVVWNFTHTFKNPVVRYFIEYGSLSILFMAFLLALYAVIFRGLKQIKRSSYLLPLSYCLLFLVMYVQHHMATIKAPRYAINFWCMLLCLMWSLAIAGQIKRLPKIISIVLFCAWILFQIAGTVFFITGDIAGTRTEQMIMRDVVSAAHKQKLTSVVTYGDKLFGLKAQKFSMYAQNSIAFAHADLERYQGNAQFTETDLHRGYLTTAEYKTSLENTLKGLNVDFTVERVHNYFLFSALQYTKQFVMRVVPNDEITPVFGTDEKKRRIVESLIDRSQDVSPEFPVQANTPLFFDTGRMRKLCGLWMFTSQDLYCTEWREPGQYEVSVSSDGVHYDIVYRSLPHTGNGFHAGPNVYVGGAWGKIESLFTPVLARYVRIVFFEQRSFPITELFVFQTDGTVRQDRSDDTMEMVQLVRSQDLNFVWADRWVSARLLEEFQGTGKREVALPRHSTRFKNKPLRYFVRPGKGRAIVCDMAVADACEKTLVRQYGESVILHRFDLHNYVLFSLGDGGGHDGGSSDRSALLWNGHVPLQSKDISLLAPFCNELGLPVWRADFTKTKGVYHDSWTNGKGIFYNLDYRIDHDLDKEFVLYTHGWRPGNNDMTKLQLKIFVNKKIPLRFKEKRKNAYVFFLPTSLDRLDKITIQSTTFVPNSQDSRSLGMDIKRIEVQ